MKTPEEMAAYKNQWAKDHPETGKKWLKANPWYVNYRCAQQRCTRPISDHQGTYLKRGIKFLMTVEDFKTLWFRDKAYLMKRPTIDRKDTNGNYTLKNCQYLEHQENSRKKHYHTGIEWEKHHPSHTRKGNNKKKSIN